MPEFSEGFRKVPEESYKLAAQCGYEAVQEAEAELSRVTGLMVLGNGVIPSACDAMQFAWEWKQRGAIAATCIAGFGDESATESNAIVRSILEASARCSLPIYLETHRGSITQDSWRTIQLLEANPDLLLTGDFSHWFTGQEMMYGDMHRRMEFLEPVFCRTALLHGRIGDRCCMQVDLTDGNHSSIPYFEHMWTRVMDHFLTNDTRKDLWFCPELLGPKYAYARTSPGPTGEMREESDRWTQAKILVRVASRCYERALQNAPEPTNKFR